MLNDSWWDDRCVWCFWCSLLPSWPPFTWKKARIFCFPHRGGSKPSSWSLEFWDALCSSSSLNSCLRSWLPSFPWESPQHHLHFMLYVSLSDSAHLRLTLPIYIWLRPSLSDSAQLWYTLSHTLPKCGLHFLILRPTVVCIIPLLLNVTPVKQKLSWITSALSNDQLFINLVVGYSLQSNV